MALYIWHSLKCGLNVLSSREDLCLSQTGFRGHFPSAALYNKFLPEISPLFKVKVK